MSAGAFPVRSGRFYTAARRHPWVLGKVADWKIPLGPYTPAQITVAVGGGFALFKSIALWSWMGPVPVVAWVLAIWAVRRPKVRGRTPLQAALGWMLLAWQPVGGRLGGRAARDRAPHAFLGGFTIEDAPAPGLSPKRSPSRAARRPGRPRRAVVTAPVVRPVGPLSQVQQLLALAEQAGGGR
ncbi:hypothetical protein ACFWC5_21595 [Streptomyces sp. NPDC060085]|uniref:hypothetical protein n=1 Tax=Streptomyces sp. NPDC060085 TaxID=3347054 RepID=UPI00364D47DB